MTAPPASSTSSCVLPLGTVSVIFAGIGRRSPKMTGRISPVRAGKLHFRLASIGAVEQFFPMYVLGPALRGDVR
jgi:cytochrome c oxidase subunit 1